MYNPHVPLKTGREMARRNLEKVAMFFTPFASTTLESVLPSSSQERQPSSMMKVASSNNSVDKIYYFGTGELSPVVKDHSIDHRFSNIQVLVDIGEHLARVEPPSIDWDDKE
ncbi:hypothetical protein VKT23_010391 [Stygiomarasmius scandens]|uniref:Uncharacterized protein n=1 Tax=Marasmiellus scandens TaxID=2682957 RepID=A0ABR1JE31_9AGAR